MQHLASVNELGDALAKHTTEQPQKMRSAIALSAAPASSSNASLREYGDWTHFDRYMYVCMCVCVFVCICVVTLDFECDVALCIASHCIA